MKYGIKYHILSIRDSVCELIKNNALYLVLLASVFACGLVLGVVLTLQTESAEDTFYSYNWLMACVANNDINAFAYVFLRLLLLAFIAFILLLSVYKICFICVYIIGIFYLGMSLSGTIVLMFCLHGIMCLPMLICGYIIFEFIFCAYLLLFASCMVERCIQNHKYGCSISIIHVAKVLSRHILPLLSLVICQTIAIYICLIFII